MLQLHSGVGLFEVMNFINPVQKGIVEITMSRSYGDIKEHPFFQCE
jgi:hypothetical protein